MSSKEFWKRNQGRKVQKEIAAIAEWLSVDPRAVQILYNAYYDLDHRKNVWPLSEYLAPPAEDLAFAKAEGVFHDPVEMTHDEIHASLKKWHKSTSQADVSACFVAGIARGRYDLKAPLAAYAAFAHYPAHEYELDPSATSRRWCAHCGVVDKELVDRNRALLTQRKIHGGGGSLDPVRAMIYLEEFARRDAAEPTKAEWSNFRKLLSAIRKLPEKAKTGELVKASTGLVQGDKWVRVRALETLGACGILKPAVVPWSPKAYFAAELPAMRELAIRENREWQRPVSGWCGADGVNEEAVAWWFPGCEGGSRPKQGHVAAVRAKAVEKKEKSERKAKRAKKPPKRIHSDRWPEVGDVFAVPLRDNLYGACRIINRFDDEDPTGFLLGPCFYVASTQWVGKKPPSIDEPLLRKIQVTRKAKQIVCVQYPPPRYFPKIGTIRPTAAERRLRIQHFGGWGVGVEMLRQWRWEHEQAKVLKEQEPVLSIAEETDQRRREMERRMKKVAALTPEQFRRRRRFAGWKDRVPKPALDDVRRALQEAIDTLAELDADADTRQRSKPLRDFAQRVRQLDEQYDYFLYEQETDDIVDVIRELGAWGGLHWGRPEVGRAVMKVLDRIRSGQGGAGAGTTISVR